MTEKQTLLILKALGDETRLRIFSMLRNGSLCACKIQEAFDITQPTLSHHMKILCEAGIIDSERRGKWTYYSVNCRALKELVDFLSDTKCNRK